MSASTNTTIQALQPRPNFPMKTNTLNTIITAVVLTSVGIYCFTQVEFNLSVAGVVLANLAGLAIFGLAAADRAKLKRQE